MCEETVTFRLVFGLSTNLPLQIIICPTTHVNLSIKSGNYHIAKPCNTHGGAEMYNWTRICRPALYWLQIRFHFFAAGRLPRPWDKNNLGKRSASRILSSIGLLGTATRRRPESPYWKGFWTTRRPTTGTHFSWSANGWIIFAEEDRTVVRIKDIENSPKLEKGTPEYEKQQKRWWKAWWSWSWWKHWCMTQKADPLHQLRVRRPEHLHPAQKVAESRNKIRH